MSKMRKEMVVKSSIVHGSGLSLTHYPYLSKKKRKALINRLHKKHGGVLLLDNSKEFCWPESGVRAMMCKSDITETIGVVVIYGKSLGIDHVSLNRYKYIWGRHGLIKRSELLLK